MKLEKEILIKRNNNFYLDSECHQVLSVLYKPLLGINAIDAYKTLYNISLKHEKVNLLLVLDLLQSRDDELEFNLEKLKEYKLIKYNSQEIELYSGLNKEEFNDSILFSNLKKVTSKLEFDYLINEVYSGHIKQGTDKAAFYKAVKKSMIPFNFNDLVSNLCDKDILVYEKEIRGIALAYNYSLEEMLRMFYEMDEFNMDEFREIAFNRFKNKKGLNDSHKEDEEENINFIRNYSPEKIFLNNKVAPSESDINTVKRLREETSFTEELISLLVVYSLATHSNKLYPFTFYEKIEADWKEKSIETLDEAYNYITKLYEDFSKKSKGSKKVSAEDWYKEYLESARGEAND